jgi:hypothetical protein
VEVFLDLGAPARQAQHKGLPAFSATEVPSDIDRVRAWAALRRRFCPLDVACEVRGRRCGLGERNAQFRAKAVDREHLEDCLRKSRFHRYQMTYELSLARPKSLRSDPAERILQVNQMTCKPIGYRTGQNVGRSVGRYGSALSGADSAC